MTVLKCAQEAMLMALQKVSGIVECRSAYFSAVNEIICGKALPQSPPSKAPDLLAHLRSVSVCAPSSPARPQRQIGIAGRVSASFYSVLKVNARNAP